MQKELKNINWLFLEKAFSLPLQLLSSIILARYFGGRLMGEYSYLVSLTMLVMPLTQMGLNALLVREFLSEQTKNRVVFGTAFTLRILGCILASVILIIYGFGWAEEYIVLVFALSAGILFSSLSFLEYWFQAQLEAKYCVWVRTSVIFFATVLRIGLVLANAPLSFFIYLFALETSLFGLVFYLMFRLRYRPHQAWKLSFSVGESLIRQSWMLLLSGFAAAVYLRIDIVMLKILAGQSAAGVYFVASRISEIWYFIPTAIVVSFFPRLLKSRSEDRARYETELQRLCDLLFVIGLLITLCIFVISYPLIRVLFGDEYISAASVLRIHIFASVFIFMRALLSKWIIAEGILIFSLVTQITGAIFNVFLNLMLIPNYGIEGAAWATLISYSFASYWTLFLFDRTRPMAIIITRSILFFPRLFRK